MSNVGDTLGKRILVREVKKLALTRMEEAARTENDFIAVMKKWNTIEETAARKQRRYGFYTTLDLIDWLSKQERWFKFLDIIFCNPEEMHVLVADYDISKLIERLRHKPKEILFLTAICLQKPKQIAEFKGQTDKAVRKLRNITLDNLRNDLCERLLVRISKNGAITPNQRQLLEEYLLEQYLSEGGQANAI